MDLLPDDRVLRRTDLGIVRWLLYIVHFTTVVPGFLVEPFFRRSFLESYWGILIGWGSFVIFSIVAAYLYKALLGRFSGPGAGILYGILWWVVLFASIGPLIGLMAPLPQLGWNTIVAELCVFTVWGLFIGYSIAFEFHDESEREPMGSKARSASRSS
ncbi:YqhR family membrane protein [Paenibacillus sp. 1P07SE]|uniref:YqhR family membrane protein n=1 Tax=Paenibacillus sp. 1P07SE TaxID=3132209 RepID=UPI0039A4FABA